MICSAKRQLSFAPRMLAGFTLIELMLVIAIIGTLAGMALFAHQGYIKKVKIGRAIAEIRMLQREIEAYEISGGDVPDSLMDIGHGNLLDPWGNNYQFLNFDNVAGKGKMRKDRFMVPINSDYDLYSMGQDGKSQPPLTAKASHDDIILANDGRFVGLASQY